MWTALEHVCSFKAHITHKTTRVQFTLTHTKLYGLYCASQMNKWMFIWKKFASTLLRENYNSCFLFHSHFALFIIPLVPFFFKAQNTYSSAHWPNIGQQFSSFSNIYVHTLQKDEKKFWNRHPHIRNWRGLRTRIFLQSGRALAYSAFSKKIEFLFQKFPWI